MSIVLDTREQALRQHMPEAEVRQLDAGDAEIRAPDGALLLVERKTVSDLAASIVDGRWHEQRQRALAAVDGEARRLLYAIEGLPPLSGAPYEVAGLSAEALRTALVRVQLDGCGVYTVADVAETAALLRKLASVAREHGVGARSMEYASCVRVRKTDNLADPATVAVLQLCVVNGITAVTAAAVLGRFGVTTIAGLHAAYVRDGREAWIAGVASLSRGKKRLGPAKAQELARLLFADAP